MPAKTTNRKIAQRARERGKGRSAKPKPVRKRGERAEAAPAVIANSIFDLRLKQKPGGEVFFTLKSGNEVAHKDVEQMYKELYASYERIYVGVKGQETRDVHQYGIDMPMAFHHMLSNLKMGLLPSGYNFNIEFDERCGAVQKYFFEIFHECEWQQQWHELEVGPTLLHLAKNNKPLHDLFLSFLKAFRNCGPDLWNEGFMGSTLEYFEESAEEYRGAGEIEAAESMEKSFVKYSKGEAAKYAKLIIKAKTIKPAEMRRRAKLYKKDQEIANLIHQGSFIIEGGNNIYRYRYQPVKPDDGWDFYVDLDSQCNIIWDYSDSFTSYHREALDNDANNGYIQDPVWHRPIVATTKDFDFAKFANEVRWPIQLSRFFDTANELIHKYTTKIKKNERSDRKSGKGI